MNQKSEIGKLGEDMACEYLVSKGYKICERNFRKPWGEIDVVAKDPERVLVFVEVKAMRQFGNAAIQPEENLTAAKLRKLKRTSSLYAGFSQELIDEKKGWRIDLIAISLPTDVSRETYKTDVSKNNLTNYIKNCEIKHFENI